MSTTLNAPGQRRYADLPGPRGIPVFGNALQVDKARMHQSVERWANQYGPYFRFRIGDRRFLGIADHEALATLMRDRPEGVRRGAKLEQIWRELGLAIGVFTAEGDVWRRQRRMVMAGFDPAHVREYFPSLQRVAHRLAGRWSVAAREGRAIDLQSDLMRFTVDAIAGLAFGSDVNTLESDSDRIQQHLDKLFPTLFKRIMAPLPTWRWFRSAVDREAEAAVAEVKRAIDGFIAQARERLAADPARRERPPNLLEAMLAAADAGDSGLGDDDVAGNVLIMLLAGEDTTANTIAWMLYLMTRHPQTLERARREVDAALPPGAPLSHEGLAALDWVEACAHETMRLKPVAPFIGLQLLRDTVVAGIEVPKGTVVWSVMRHDSVNPKHFPEPQAFKPERWLADGGPGQAAASAKRVSMPFGAGPRVCPGRYMALLEIKLAVAMLLREFDIVALETPDGAEARERLEFTMRPEGLTMRLKERAVSA
ncbi:cytochrome P450 [uncultured Piscinibacter sp.]|uniref:cytochrome P450 n=1 Tax=uncultured Piscinibacter sp. TaxID=1131835 RepID=UPI002610B7A7|nr:cytochrome P450 [uncultured Piscinibacter sp.]